MFPLYSPGENESYQIDFDGNTQNEYVQNQDSQQYTEEQIDIQALLDEHPYTLQGSLFLY